MKLNPPKFSLCQFRTQPPNLIPTNISNYTVSIEYKKDSLDMTTHSDIYMYMYNIISLIILCRSNIQNVGVESSLTTTYTYMWTCCFSTGTVRSLQGGASKVLWNWEGQQINRGKNLFNHWFWGEMFLGGGANASPQMKPNLYTAIWNIFVKWQWRGLMRMQTHPI